MDKLEVTVRVQEKAKASLDDVVDRLAHAGLSEISCSKRFGIVHGVVNSTGQDKLRGIDGVASVRASQEFKAS